MSANDEGATPTLDVVVVGAGFAGLYLLHQLRELGLSARCFEAGEDVGGTWYWNRYPGARCDVPSVDYSYSFDPELERTWTWTEKYATQPEILGYLRHVASKHDLRRDVTFGTRIERARWLDEASCWELTTSSAETVTCRFYVMATGCLSQPKRDDVDGIDRFGGPVYHTSRWPHEPVDLTGKRVAVIGTGSSGIQTIPVLAQEASELTVFQRTPNFSMPAHNGPIPAAKLAAIDGRVDEYREEARQSLGGVPYQAAEVGVLDVSEEERLAAFERVWKTGELFAVNTEFTDVLLNPEANEALCDFIRGKIRSIVEDPATAEALCPSNHPFGTKRPCLDTNYYQTYNLPHVKLVDVRNDPITTITETGIETAHQSLDVDVIVFATGFDAMTGAITAVEVEGRNGVELRDKWAGGPTTYLGLMVTEFPNFFTITGPGSPSVLSNMVVSIEQHVDWITGCVDYLRREGHQTIEPTTTAEAGWVQHVSDVAALTLYPRADSWYMGANVPGKPRVFLPYVGGVGAYRQICDEVVERGYLGFELAGPQGRSCNDGVIRPLQPDVTVLLDVMADLDLPPIETLPVEAARDFMNAQITERPPGPEVGEVSDGHLQGAGGPLEYRLYRPAGDGPHPVIAYFHGGGWVLGNLDSDDPFCRDLCARTGAVVVSVNYRHAPEHRFPAAAEDAFAAVTWIGAHLPELGGIPGQLAVCGWSAGANIAAVACQLARDAGQPAIAGQLLVTPVTDCDLTRPSYTENGDGYVLTTALLAWFWDHYADPADRTDPRASPLRAADLSNLPPTLVVTSQFDPLRDEGIAYAEALAAAGSEARHLSGRGQIHTSLTAVDLLPSGAAIRAEMADALRQFLATRVAV